MNKRKHMYTEPNDGSKENAEAEKEQREQFSLFHGFEKIV